jgi:MerR family transcriptional regulator, redox-sensitive transcriptional activator SoxR
MLIGEVARRAGVAASALRYYEREGLLPPPARSANRRTYDSRVMRIHIIQLARDAGFSIAETRTFISSHPSGSIPSVRWQTLADRKVHEIDALIARATQMKSLLKSSFKCGCLTIEDCERPMLAREPRILPHPERARDE